MQRLICLFVALTTIGVAHPTALLAQASRAGDSFAIPGIASSLKRFPDVAHDATNNVYLVVYGNGTVGGAFVSTDGVPVGAPFALVSTGAWTQTPRAAFAPDTGTFLVTWLDTRVNPNRSGAWGRILAFNGSGATPVTGDFQISAAPGGVHSEMGVAIAYSSVSKEFLVAWMQYGPANGQFDIRAQRVSTSGALLGGEITITADNAWQAQPAIAYNPTLNEFFIVYGYSPASGGDFVMGQRVQAGTGALQGGATVIYGGVFLTVPDVQFIAGSSQYLVAWYQGSPSPVFNARLVNGDGSAAGSVFPIAIGYGSYDGFDMAYNSVSNTTFAVFHDNFTPENFGLELGATGTPSAIFRVTSAGGTGNFNPRVGANAGRAEWLSASARSFSLIVGQRVQTSTRAPGSTPPPSPTPSPTPTPSPNTFTLVVSQSGGGRIVATGIDCRTTGGDCSEAYGAGTPVALSPTPDAGYAFAGWSGDADCLDGVAIMDAGRSCQARFVRVLGTANRRAADLTGDGAGDAVLYSEATGDFFIAHHDTSGTGGRNGTGDFTYTRGTWQTGWLMKAADLNGDTAIDLFMYNPETGQWVQAINNRTGGFSYFSGSFSPGWQFFVARLNADGIDDIFLYNRATGVAFQCWSNGSGGFSSFFQFAWDGGWDVYIARLDFFPTDDVFLYSRTTGTWVRAFSNGDGTFIYNSGVWSPLWTVTIGDLNGDGVDDIALYNADTGTWFTCLNTVTDFVYTSGVWSTGWRLYAARLNSDGSDDLFLYKPETGDWSEMMSDGRGGLTSSDHGGWSSGWDIYVTEFNADGINDLFLYNVVTGSWFKFFAAPAGGFSSHASGSWSPGWRITAVH